MEERVRAAREVEEAGRAEERARFVATGSGSGVRRRWDDDVVFRHQARDEPPAKKRFLNDTIRNDFHLKFLKRYVK